MANPVTFESSTPNIGMPFLLAGQAQKEFFLNQSLGILDALQSNTVSASRSMPPIAPIEGACFRVTAPATDAWAGCEDHLAIRIGADWHFISPRDGMRIFDGGAHHTLVFLEGWQFAEAPEVPTTGVVIDIEARAALAQLIDALRNLAIFNSNLS